jgi:hypothetical protein
MPIQVFTMLRSSCSRWTDPGVHDGPKYAQCTPDTWSSFAGKFFQDYCNRCHGFTQQTVSQDPNVGPEIQGRYMPPSLPNPSTADVSRILTWIQCGEP